MSRFVCFCFSPNLWFTLTLLQPSDGLVRSEEFIRRTISTSEPNHQAINFRTINFHGVTKTSKQFAQLAMALCHTSRIPSEAGHSSPSFQRHTTPRNGRQVAPPTQSQRPLRRRSPRGLARLSFRVGSSLFYYFLFFPTKFLRSWRRFVCNGDLALWSCCRVSHSCSRGSALPHS